MKKIILIALIGILFLSMVYAYTPVPYYSANLTLTMEYTPVVYSSANLTLGEEEPPVEDNCTISIDTTFTDEEIDCSGKSFIVKNSATANFINSNLTADNVIIEGGGIEGICYQETANEPTACGGIGTGVYAFDGGNWQNQAYSNDGDWDTFGYISASNDGHMYVNYTKPIGALNTTLWQTKTGSGLVEENHTLTDGNCWDAYSDKLVLRIRLQESDLKTIPQCHNGTDWYSFSSNSNYRIYDESLWLNITGSGSKIIKDLSSILTIGE